MGYFDDIVNEEPPKKKKGYFDDIVRSPKDSQTPPQETASPKNLLITQKNGRTYVEARKNRGASTSWEEPSYENVSLPEAIAEGATNFLPSLGKYALDVTKAMTVNAPQTVEVLSELLAEGAGTVFGQELPRPALHAAKQQLLQQYGSWANIKRTIAKDPAVFAADLASVLGLVSAPARLAGFSAKLAGATELSKKIYDTIRPVTQAATISEPINLGKAVAAPIVKGIAQALPDSAPQWFFDAAARWNDAYKRKVPKQDRARIAKTALTEDVMPSSAGPDRARALREEPQNVIRGGANVIEDALSEQVGKAIQEEENKGAKIKLTPIFQPIVDSLKDPTLLKEADSGVAFFNDTSKAVAEQLSAYAATKKYSPGRKMLSYRLNDFLDSAGNIRTKPEPVFVPTGRFGKNGKMIFKATDEIAPYIVDEISPTMAQNKKKNLQAASSYAKSGKAPPVSSHTAATKKEFARGFRKSIEELANVKEPNARMEALYELQDVYTLFLGSDRWSLSPNDIVKKVIFNRSLMFKLAKELNELKTHGLVLSPNAALLRSGLIEMNTRGEYVAGKMKEQDSHLIQPSIKKAKETVDDFIEAVNPFFNKEPSP